MWTLLTDFDFSWHVHFLWTYPNFPQTCLTLFHCVFFGRSFCLVPPTCVMSYCTQHNLFIALVHTVAIVMLSGCNPNSSLNSSTVLLSIFPCSLWNVNRPTVEQYTYKLTVDWLWCCGLSTDPYLKQSAQRPLRILGEQRMPLPLLPTLVAGPPLHARTWWQIDIERSFPNMGRSTAHYARVCELTV